MVLSKKGNYKGADQTAWMRRLVCTCVVHKHPKTGFLLLRPIVNSSRFGLFVELLYLKGEASRYVYM